MSLNKETFKPTYYLSMYLPNPSTTGRVWYKINLICEIQLVWIQSIPSPRLDTRSKYLNQVYKSGIREISWILW